MKHHCIDNHTINKHPYSYTILGQSVIALIAKEKLKPWYSIATKDYKNETYEMTEWIEFRTKDYEINRIITKDMNTTLMELKRDWYEAAEECRNYLSQLYPSAGSLPEMARFVTKAIMDIEEDSIRDKIIYGILIETNGLLNKELKEYHKEKKKKNEKN